MNVKWGLPFQRRALALSRNGIRSVERRAARADFLRRLQRWSEAALAYEVALALTDNAIERSFLAGRLTEVRDRLRD